MIILCHFPFLTQYVHRTAPFTSTEVAFSLDNSLPRTIQADSLPALIPSIHFLAPSSFTQLLPLTLSAESSVLFFPVISAALADWISPAQSPTATRAELRARSDFSTKWGCG